MNPHRDERGVILSWLIKVLVGLAVAGVILFDAGSIMVNFFGLDSTADDLAVAISTEIGAGAREPSGVVTNKTCKRLNPSAPESVEQEACDLAHDSDAKLVRLEVDSAGVVHVRLRREASTILVGRIGLIDDWGTATANGQAGTD